MRDVLNPDRALIFRIVHRLNLPWILEHGLHCRNSHKLDPNFVAIGNLDLITKRHFHPVKVAPGGTLGDYVSFYFTPFSPMLYNIKTGYNGIRRRDDDEILILVSSLRHLQKQGVPFLFTDRHASLVTARYSSQLDDLDCVDWTILQNCDFKRDNDDLGKMERYQAEALVHRHLPIELLLAVVCHNDETVEAVTILMDQMGVELKVLPKPRWYF